MIKAYEKIRAHKFLNYNDIAEIVDLISNGKVKAIFNANNNAFMAYSELNHAIEIEKNFKKKLLNYSVYFTKKTINSIDLMYSSHFLSDYYNLYIIGLIFHELRHYIQCRNNEIKTNKLVLIKESFIHMSKNYKLYWKNHDIYYLEYDASITSFCQTIKLINTNFDNLNQDAIFEFNREKAGVVCRSYGKKGLSLNVEETKIYDKFDSPICHLKYLSILFDDKKSKKRVFQAIDNLEKESTDQYLRFINGFSVSNNILDFVQDVYFGEIQSKDLIGDIKKLVKQKID